MSNFLPFGAATYNLGSSIGSTDSTILLSSFLEPVTGTPYTMALINSDIAYGTISPKTTSSEFISFTGITQNSNGTATLTGVTRGLAKKYPFTSDATYQLPHSGQSTFIISDAPQVFNKYVTLEDTETISGTKTFSASPIVPTPTTPTQAANKAYADALAIAGAPNASTSVQGLVQEATQAQVDAKTVIGSTGAKLFQNLSTVRSTLTSDYIADTGSANTYAITPSPAITAYTTGQIFSFKATNANTTASTLNVSSLGVKNIFKRGSLALVANDIIVGQIVQVEYDGTQFQMLSQLGNAKISQIGTEIYAADSVGTDAYAITLVPAITAYTTGLVVNFKAGTANTGNATLAINGLAAKNILNKFNQTLNNNDILAGQIVKVIYDSTADNFQMQSNIANSPTGLIFSSTNQNNVTLTTAYQNVYTTQSIPANTLGTANILTIPFNFNVDLNSVITCLIQITYGGTVLFTITLGAAGAATPECRGVLYLYGAGATNSQFATCMIATDGSASKSAYFGSGTAAIDSTAAQNLIIQAKEASGSTTFRPHDYFGRVER